MSFWSHLGNAQMLGGLRKDSEQAAVIMGLIVAWNSLGIPWRSWGIRREERFLASLDTRDTNILFIMIMSFAEDACRTLILCFAIVRCWDGACSFCCLQLSASRVHIFSPIGNIAPITEAPQTSG